MFNKSANRFMTMKAKLTIAALLGFGLTLSQAFAALTVSNHFGENMVVQRGTAVKVFGSANAGQSVSVSFAGQTKSATASSAGKWTITLDSMVANAQSQEMKIKAGAEVITLANILIGDVWLCSGQSNMAWKLSEVWDETKPTSDTNRAGLRFLRMPLTSEYTKQTERAGKWETSTWTSASLFSAVGYYFGSTVNEQSKVPMGMIMSAWGGTSAELWTPYATLQSTPELVHFAQRFNDNKPGVVAREAELELESQAWLDNLYTLSQTTPSSNYLEAIKTSPNLNWKPITMPGFFEDKGVSQDGVIWLRRNFNVPADRVTNAPKFHLGKIDDADMVWINGYFAGKTNIDDSTTPAGINRVYALTSGKIKAGSNQILIRVTDYGSKGGPNGLPHFQLSLTGTDSISLAGDWEYYIEHTAGRRPNVADAQRYLLPSAIFNGMIAPLAKLPIKGVLWYQGEANVGRGEQYKALLPAMISAWRSEWGQPNMPFYYVQLANHLDKTTQPGDSDWARLREAQFKTLSTSNTGMAVAIDIGEADNIHPVRKKEVGDRLSRWALAEHYKSEASIPASYVKSGPLFTTHQISGSTIKVKFDHIGTGLKAKSGTLQGFAIAGSDKVFKWATVKIVGSLVEVSHPSIASPVAVRYSWADNPDGNLVNSESLPASPFRTDSW
jgi:sialate O-acetylesterase